MGGTTKCPTPTFKVALEALTRTRIKQVSHMPPIFLTIAWDAIVALSKSTSRVLSITHGHNHGETWCGRTKDSNSIPICYDGHSGQ